ncbi:hypothetical protein VNO77_14088 [Canavalia gladiata]|uniref:Uncharacterized protein n=1 Tax=Canavalia gladiata TaxID=3824 RepID=A0AAN9LYE0_CANGL
MINVEKGFLCKLEDSKTLPPTDIVNKAKTGLSIAIKKASVHKLFNSAASFVVSLVSVHLRRFFAFDSHPLFPPFSLLSLSLSLSLSLKPFCCVSLSTTPSYHFFFLLISVIPFFLSHTTLPYLSHKSSHRERYR